MINEKGDRDGSPGLTDAARLEIEAVEMEIGDGATLIGFSRKRNAGRPFDSIFFRRSAKVYEPGAKLEQSDAENGVGARLIIRFLNVAALDSVMATLAEIRAHLEASAAKPAEQRDAEQGLSFSTEKKPQENPVPITTALPQGQQERTSP